MAGLFLDSFLHYGTADILTKWDAKTNGGSGITTIDPSAGRYGGQCLKLHYVAGLGSEPSVLKTPGASGTTAIFGGALKVSALPAGAHPLVIFWQGGAEQVSFCLNADLSFGVRRGQVNFAPVLGVSSDGLPVGAFHWVDFKVVISDTVGTVTIKLDNATILNLSGLDTKATATAAWDAVSIGSTRDNAEGNPGIDVFWNDVYCCDGTGAVNNDILGDGRVVMELPAAGNGSSVGWTPSTGTDHGALVRENPPDTTSYNSTNTVGVRDTYNYPNLGVTGTVRFVQTCHYAIKTDAGARTVCPVHRIAGVNYDGTAVSPATAYAYLLQPYNVSPATGVAWTTAELDATETGSKLVT